MRLSDDLALASVKSAALLDACRPSDYWCSREPSLRAKSRRS